MGKFTHLSPKGCNSNNFPLWSYSALWKLQNISSTYLVLCLAQQSLPCVWCYITNSSSVLSVMQQSNGRENLFFLEHHLTCRHFADVQTQSRTAWACLLRLGSSICFHYRSARVYFCPFLSRSCSTRFFRRHMNLTNPSGMSQGGASHSYLQHKLPPNASGYGTRLTQCQGRRYLLLFTSTYVQSQMSSHLPSVGKKPNQSALIYVL